MIMVDEFKRWAPTDVRCFKRGSCHLTTSGPLWELHLFAELIGVHRKHFQQGTAPRYDLTDKRRERALTLGATFVPAKTQAKRRKAGRGMNFTRDEADTIRDSAGLGPLTNRQWREWCNGAAARLMRPCFRVETESETPCLI